MSDNFIHGVLNRRSILLAARLPDVFEHQTEFYLAWVLAALSVNVIVDFLLDALNGFKEFNMNFVELDFVIFLGSDVLLEGLVILRVTKVWNQRRVTFEDIKNDFILLLLEYGRHPHQGCNLFIPLLMRTNSNMFPSQLTQDLSIQLKDLNEALKMLSPFNLEGNRNEVINLATLLNLADPFLHDLFEVSNFTKRFANKISDSLENFFDA